MNDTITVRVANPRDAERLLEIYKPYVETTAITYEYVVPTVEEFICRIENTLKKYPYLVAILQDKIVGYAYASTYIGRAACDWSVETSIYVDMEYRNCGIGKRLYIALEQILKEMNILNLNAAIAVPETEDEYLTFSSVRFHEELGYQPVGEFHNCGYKFGRWYKLLWMEKMLGEHTLYPKPVAYFKDIKSHYKMIDNSVR